MLGVIIYNENKTQAIKVYEQLKKFFFKKKIELVSKNEIEKVQFAVVIGGDGTLLRASKLLIKNQNIDVFAVNAGTLGFLTEIKVFEFEKTFDEYLKGDIKKESRQLLEIEIRGKKFDALNEVVISKMHSNSKILDISVTTEKTKICSYKADGMIVATPTGSTAYSLSAGGPIVMPEIKAMVVTPIAPHNLATRPIVIDGLERLTLKLKSNQEGSLVVDGDIELKIGKNEETFIRYSGKKITLILPKDRDYFSILREKLKWGDNLC